MTLLISKVEKLQLVAPAGRRGVVAIAQSVHYMIPAKPKPIKLEGTNLGWRDSTARAELKSMLMNDDDSWEYLTMPAEELQKL